MYLEYYGLEQPPFAITPDPTYVFLGEHHRDALAHLLYGIRQGGGGGFVQLTGEVGTGKTTLSRLLLSQLPEGTHAALVLNPRLDPIELLETVCEELRIPLPARPRRGRRGPPAPRSGKALFDALGAFLLDVHARGERAVLVIDEAQNLSIEALEQVRLLTNLETETQKLLQIILIGQPELRDVLARPDLRQLAQRITARYHLRPLTPTETAGYLRHRLTTAGATRFPFTADAVERLHRRSGGIPRLVNVIAERALLAGYAHDLLAIDARTVDRAADEALAPTQRPRASRRALAMAVGVTVLLAAIAAGAYAWRQRAVEAPVVVPPPVATTPVPGDLLALRTALAAASRDTQAWDALRAAWKAPDTLATMSPDACPVAPARGWRCLRGRATLEQLLQSDRPVLLHLHAEPTVGWVLLEGADAGHVRVRHAGRAYTFDRVALAGVWNGEYLALWRAPPGLEADFARGDEAARRWVEARLGAAPTREALAAFQSRHGLRDVGTLDAATALALSARDAGPRLGAPIPPER